MFLLGELEMFESIFEAEPFEDFILPFLPLPLQAICLIGKKTTNSKF